MTPNELDDALQQELDEQTRLLYKLSQLEEFRVWRDIICQPQLDFIERHLEINADGSEISEVELRARIKYRNNLKYMFKQIFDSAATKIRLDKE